jgi:hypothetical protein
MHVTWTDTKRTLRRRLLAVVMVYALLLATLAPAVLAQAPEPVPMPPDDAAGTALYQTGVGSVLQGHVQQVVGDHWQDLHQDVPIARGMILRTADDGRFQIRFADGSTILMNGCTAVRIVDLQEGHLHLKAIGLLQVDLRPDLVNAYLNEFDFPTGRVAINSRMAAGHGIADARANAEAMVNMGTVTADQLKVVVQTGAATVYGLPNVKGSVVADPSTGAVAQNGMFYIQDVVSGRLVGVQVTNGTLLSTNSKSESRRWLPSDAIMSHLHKGQPVVVYGRPGMSAAPQSYRSQRDRRVATRGALGLDAPTTFSAATIFDGNNRFINGERFVGARVETPVGDGVGTASGYTGTLPAGNTVAAVQPGLQNLACDCDLGFNGGAVAAAPAAVAGGGGGGGLGLEAGGAGALALWSLAGALGLGAILAAVLEDHNNGNSTEVVQTPNGTVTTVTGGNGTTTIIVTGTTGGGTTGGTGTTGVTGPTGITNASQ